MTIKEKLTAIKTLTVRHGNYDEKLIMNMANHIAGEVIIDIKKQVSNIKTKLKDMVGMCQIRLPETYGQEIAELAIKKLNAKGYYSEYRILDNINNSFCFYITASMLHEFKNKPNKIKNEIIIKQARETRTIFVKNTMLNHMKSVTEVFDYELKVALLNNKTNQTITITEKDVRLINNTIAADIEDYLDIAINTAKEFCEENGIIMTNIKKHGDALVFADLTIEI